MILPIVCQALVEISVFFLGDVIGITSPDWLGLVELLIFGIFLLNLFGLFGFRLRLLLILFDLFNLWLVLFCRLFFFFSLIIGHLLLFLLGHHQIDGVSDELRVLLHNLLDLLFLQKLGLVILKVENDSGSSGKVGDGIGIQSAHSEASSSSRLPLIMIV